MSNSDAFEHIHRVRDSRVRQALDATERHLHAARADLDRTLAAFRAADPGPGGGIAGGGVTGGDRPDPTGNAATSPHRDGVTHIRADFDLAVAELEHAARRLTAVGRQLHRDPTPTGLCRDGACPDGKMADRGRIMAGVARCHACYQFWIRDASNPLERLEREYRGQSPRRIGLEQVAS